MVLHQFDYIFAIAMIFAFLDAWNIGANDVANSFASSVSSRSLKLWQALILAGICEFLGATLVGSRVSDTIRSNIVDVSVFEDSPAVLMLTMSCALIGSSLWLSIATSVGMPVSTTHSIVGAVIGSAIAARGASNVHWGWGGVASIIASWFIAPLVAGVIASVVFFISKYGVLEVKDINRSIKNALIMVPVLVFLTLSILTMLIVWDGAPSLHLDNLSSGATAGSIVGVGAVASLLYILFCYPVFKRKILHDDWTLKWYDVFRGPIYWFKSTDNIPPIPEGHSVVIDYYEGRRYDEPPKTPEEIATNSLDEKGSPEFRESVVSEQQSVKPELKTSQLWWSLLKGGPKKWPKLVWLVVSHGFTKDIINMQASSKDMLAGNLKKMHNKSKYYDNKLEYLYSLLQAITACTMSFAHGSNDIANATGPLATVYLVWRSNTTGEETDVPVWVLAYAAAALVIGCWTYGYRIMSNLGNKLILQSPSRGFAIELGAAITTVIASRVALPISTTQCAVGATVFIGLCNKDLHAVNWRMVLWCYMGWIFTLPIAGIIAGVINGIILNAPRLGATYSM